MQVSVVIPTLNEARSIRRVVRAIPRALVTEIIVVDNGSTDSTAREARAAGATVLVESRRGYGYACLLGIEYARTTGADVLVFMDGDFSDYPEEMDRLLRPIEESAADIVVGSRTLGNSQPGALLPQARIGNWIACSLMKLLWGGSFTDLGPFRAIRLQALDRLNMREGAYGWTVEMQIRALQEQLSCVEVPVSYRKRIGKSKVTGTLGGTIRASVGILSTILRLALNRGKPSIGARPHSTGS